jgi:hypothetical protein
VRIHFFFPHGVGHLVGLGVRDASGRYPGRLKDETAALKNLRMDLPLAAGYVTTVEPGVYFIPSILNDPKRRRQHRQSVDWHRVDHCRLSRRSYRRYDSCDREWTKGTYCRDPEWIGKRKKRDWGSAGLIGDKLQPIR